MAYVSSLLAAMSDSQRREYYFNCAKVVLAHYELGTYSTHFVQHNAGIVFRLDDTQGEPRFLLKIHESAGEGLMDTPEQIASQMAWLQALTKDGRVMVQSPIANRAGKFITQIELAGLDRLSTACCQRWISAHHVGKWDKSHAYAVGKLLATLHTVGQEWQGGENEQFGSFQTHHLIEAIDDLAVMVDLGVISTEQYDLICRAGERILAMLARIERTQATFGLIHGDLNQSNVLFDGLMALPLDFSTSRSFFLYDLGVSLYHTTYEEVAIRNALVAGYEGVRPLAQKDNNSLEAHMIMAALFNLAFQATLVEHRLSPINRRNMLQLVEKFCRPCRK